jgi:hypothetical protein
MSDETMGRAEFPLQQVDAHEGAVALDADRGGNEGRLVPATGLALSVLWWEDGEPPTR